MKVGLHDITPPSLANLCLLDMTTKAGGILGNVAMALLLVLLAPVAIILIGTPVVLFVRLLIEIGGRL